MTLKNLIRTFLRLDENESTGVDICCVEYLVQRPDCLESLQPLYLLIKGSFVFIEECDGNKYLNNAITKSNDDVLLTYEKIWADIKEKIKKINGGKDGNYDQNYRKIKFNCDDELPLNEVSKLHTLTLIVRHVFEMNGKYYSQIFLENCLYEV